MGLSLSGDRPGPANWLMTVLDDAAGGQILRLSAVPEPTSLILLALGCISLIGLRRRT